MSKILEVAGGRWEVSDSTHDIVFLLMPLCLCIVSKLYLKSKSFMVSRKANLRESTTATSNSRS